MKLVGGQPARGQAGHERTWAGDRFDAKSGCESRLNDPLAGIADARGSGVGDERDFFAATEALQELFASFRFIKTKVAQERLGNAEVTKKLSGSTSVFRGHD